MRYGAFDLLRDGYLSNQLPFDKSFYLVSILCILRLSCSFVQHMMRKNCILHFLAPPGLVSEFDLAILNGIGVVTPDLRH